MPSTYGQFATSRLDESRLFEIREVSDVLRCPSSCWVFAFSLVLKMRFPPSVVESKHGWRTAMHLQGRNEVEITGMERAQWRLRRWAPVRR